MPVLSDLTDVLKGDLTSVAVLMSEAEEPPDLMGAHCDGSSKSWTSTATVSHALEWGSHSEFLINKEGTYRLKMSELRSHILAEAFLPEGSASASLHMRSLCIAWTLQCRLMPHTLSWEPSYILFSITRESRETDVNLGLFCLYWCRKWLLGGNSSLCTHRSQMVQYACLLNIHILCGSVVHLSLDVERGKKARDNLALHLPSSRISQRVSGLG